MSGDRLAPADQPIGEPLPAWSSRPFPDPPVLDGRDVRLERLSASHVDDLFATTCAAGTESRWTYMVAGPFADREAFAAYCSALADADNVVALAIIDRSDDRAVGMATYLRIEPQVGCLEVGSIMFSPRLGATRGATEAMYLMARYAFDDLGYRRYEWKCDALNAPSRRAADRLGFCFEGVFRQATVYKQRNRDTAWYSIIDAQWPQARVAMETWLDPANFDEAGTQRRSLAQIRDAP